MVGQVDPPLNEPKVHATGFAILTPPAALQCEWCHRPALPAWLSLRPMADCHALRYTRTVESLLRPRMPRDANSLQVKRLVVLLTFCGRPSPAPSRVNA